MTTIEVGWDINVGFDIDKWFLEDRWVPEQHRTNESCAMTKAMMAPYIINKMAQKLLHLSHSLYDVQ